MVNVPFIALCAALVLSVSGCYDNSFSGDNGRKGSENKNQAVAGNALQKTDPQPQAVVTKTAEVPTEQIAVTYTRLCSDDKSKLAQSNLTASTNGVVVKFFRPETSATAAPEFVADKDPILVRDTLLKTAQLSIAAPKGTWDMVICDVNFPECRVPAANAYYGPGAISALRGVTINGGFSTPHQQRYLVIANTNSKNDTLFGGFGKDPEGCDDAASPLIVNVNGEAIKLSSPDRGVAFDIDVDGHKDQISWPENAGTKFLVYDRNANGRIDNGSELFGDHTPDQVDKLSANGFLALAKYDSNQDRRIDANDEIFAQLQLWEDYNRNGVSEDEEFSHLSSHDLVAIDLDYVDMYEEDSWGNSSRQRSVVETSTGKFLLIFDIWFKKYFL